MALIRLLVFGWTYLIGPVGREKSSHWGGGGCFFVLVLERPVIIWFDVSLKEYFIYSKCSFNFTFKI